MTYVVPVRKIYMKLSYSIYHTIQIFLDTCDVLCYYDNINRRYMGRNVRRVPLTFKWPIDRVWRGYMHHCDHAACDGCRGCRRIDPPRGRGWQLWESTTEGAPISPVFRARAALATWAATHATVFGAETTTRAEWLAIIRGEELPPRPLSAGSRSSHALEE